jgi:Zn-finger protein
MPCQYYPCHTIQGEFDCSLCYCPFYPCKNEKLGEYLKDDIWDCSGCNIIHDVKVAYNIITSNFAFGRSTNEISKLQQINKEIEEYNNRR